MYVFLSMITRVNYYDHRDESVCSSDSEGDPFSLEVKRVLVCHTLKLILCNQLAKVSWII